MPSVNNYRPHLFVLPEDDANRVLANGFHLHEAVVYERMRVLPPAGGWVHVIDEFLRDHVSGLEEFGERFMVLLLDFDGDAKRLVDIKAKIPMNMLERVFVIGVSSEPEDLKRELGSYESIGRMLAEDCRTGTRNYWGHSLLINNSDELDRLIQTVRSFLITE